MESRELEEALRLAGRARAGALEAQVAAVLERRQYPYLYRAGATTGDGRSGPNDGGHGDGRDDAVYYDDDDVRLLLQRRRRLTTLKEATATPKTRPSPVCWP